MIENGDIYLGVATDHVIESFRNRLWPDYKTGAGIERALLAQFHPLAEAHKPRTTASARSGNYGSA